MISVNGFVICFDFGLKYIGLAIGQRITCKARPLCTLLVKDGIPDWFFLDNIVKYWNPKQFVIGVSYFCDNLNFINIRIRKFKQKLLLRYKIPVFEIDESYTTWEIKSSFKKIEKDFFKINSLSAALILNDWLRIN